MGGGEQLEAMNAHYIAAISASRAVNFVFWFYGYEEFAPAEGGYNWAGWAVISCCVIQMMLLLDFIVLYVKACVKQCVTAMQTGEYAQPMVTVPLTYDL